MDLETAAGVSAAFVASVSTARYRPVQTERCFPLGVGYKDTSNTL
jgi:hypothetical protein